MLWDKSDLDATIVQLYVCTMRYVTTNIRLPEPLWKSLKIEAAREGKRLAEVIRERLIHFASKRPVRTPRASLRGIWKGVKISDRLIDEAQGAIFTSTKKPVV